MNICSGNIANTHNEIVYDGRNCPVCEAFKIIELLEDTIKKLEND